MLSGPSTGRRAINGQLGHGDQPRRRAAIVIVVAPVLGWARFLHERIKAKVLRAAAAARSGTPCGRAAWAPVPAAVPIGRPNLGSLNRGFPQPRRQARRWRHAKQAQGRWQTRIRLP
jgi:hypothetical protein